MKAILNGYLKKVKFAFFYVELTNNYQINLKIKKKVFF